MIYYRIFLMDTINFSFWTEDDHKFRVTYKGKVYTGYFGACACVNRAIESGIPMTDANFMKNITARQVADIFQSDDGKLISFFLLCNCFRMKVWISHMLHLQHQGPVLSPVKQLLLQRQASFLR